MIQLRTQDLSDVLKLGRIALECDSQTELQQATLQRLEQTLGAESSMYCTISRSHSRWSFRNGLSRGVPDQGPKLWNQRYRKQDPFVQAFLDAPNKDSPIVVSSQILSHKELIATEFYADFLQPQSVYHVLVLGLVHHHQPIGVFGLHRPPGAAPFSNRDAEKARLLSPFLSAAVEKATRSEETLCFRDVIDKVVCDFSNRGVIVLNRIGEPLYANSKAGEMLRPANGTTAMDKVMEENVPDHVIDFCRQLDDRNAGRLTPSAELSIPRHKLITGLTLEVHRCKDGTRVLYLNDENDSNIRPDRLKEFGLTNRQCAIVHLLSTGMTNPEIAAKLFISARTVQNHLSSIYRKVNVHCRTSLVNRLSH